MDFSYKAVGAGGKIKTGQISAGTEREAAILLQKQGIVPLQITSGGEGPKNTKTRKVKQQKKSVISSASKIGTKKKSFLQLDLGDLGFKKVSNKDLILFAEDLATLLQSGVALNRSLSILGELTENIHFREIIRDIHKKIREGSVLWEALQVHSTIFPPVFINMIKAGESGGVLDVVLNRVGEYLSSVQEIRDYLVSAMIYPIILSITALSSMILLLTFVIPKFAAIFSDMGMALPLATKIMMSVGTILQSYWWVMLGVIFVSVMSFRSYIRTDAGKTVWDGIKLRMPIFGIIFKKIEIARFARTLGTLLESGVSILMAMRIVRGVVQNNVLEDALDNVYNDLKQGRMLSKSIEKTGIFPSLSIHMIGVGEETGQLEVLLNKIADIYDKELKAKIKALTSMLEPIIILVMGLGIGAMIVSMLLAIFSINDVSM